MTPGPTTCTRLASRVLVLKLMRQSENSVLIVVQALRRVGFGASAQQPYLRAEVDVLEQKLPPTDDKEWAASVKNLRESAAKLIELTPDAPGASAAVDLEYRGPGNAGRFPGQQLKS